jgi:hypothetical protein
VAQVTELVNKEIGCAIKVKKTKVKAEAKSDKTPSFIGREALTLLDMRVWTLVLDLIYPLLEVKNLSTGLLEVTESENRKRLACVLKVSTRYITALPNGCWKIHLTRVQRRHKG